MQKLSRRSAVAALGLALATTTLTVSAPTFADVIASATTAVNVDEKGLVMRGYDPVAYFTEDGPKMGKKKYAVRHTAGTYYFSSAKNKDMFMADPERYLPQYGGFCAMGVALGRKLDGDPNVWKVVDGKLYLNVNEDVSKAWNRDVPGNLYKANRNWPGIKHKTPASLG